MAQSVRYKVRARVRGALPADWAPMLGDLTVALEGTTLVSGELADQAPLRAAMVSTEISESPRPRIASRSPQQWPPPQGSAR